MTQAPADHDLLQRFIAGDQEAFTLLVGRHHALVRAACARQAGPGECDDCVQAVFLVLTRRPAAALRTGNLPGWLVRTAWFVCRHARRAAVRRQHAEHAAAQSRPAAPTNAESEALAQLDDCLQRLPDRQRAAVTLHYLAGHPAEEVAARLGISRDNAYHLLSRGLAGLRRLLARRGVALGLAALGALLGGQAQAAAAGSAAGGATTDLAAPGGTPSSTATTLAHGAMTAMTIAFATPLALAAGLLLSIGLTTAALTAEHAPAVPPAAIPPAGKPPAGSAPAGTAEAGTDANRRPAGGATARRTIEQQLDQEVTLAFEDVPLGEVVARLRKATGLAIVLDPEALAAQQATVLTFKADKMKLRAVLTFIMQMTALNYAVRDQSIVITQARRPTAPDRGAHPQGASPAL